MSKGVKVSVAKKTMKNPELSQMFNQMMGAEAPDPNIAAPKYDKIMKNTEETLDILDKLSLKTKGIPDEFKVGLNEIHKYVKMAKPKLSELKLQKSDGVYTGNDLKSINENPAVMASFLQNINCKYNVTELTTTYKLLKECAVVQEMVMICRSLKNLLEEEKERVGKKESNLDDIKNLSSDFILQSEGYTITLFNFAPACEFKAIFLSDDVTDAFRNYILKALHLIWKKTKTVVKLITDPDIDVAQFSHVLVDNIGEIKKHIPGCDEAFNKIKESVQLLEGNFNSYYYDFVQAGDPTIIIEHFVGDVAKNSKANSKVTRQFGKIVEFYKKNMQGKIKDPKMNNLFKMVTDNLDVLKDKTDKKDKAENEEDDKKDQEPELTAEEKQAKKEANAESFIPVELKTKKVKKVSTKDPTSSKQTKETVSSKKSKKTKKKDNVE